MNTLNELKVIMDCENGWRDLGFMGTSFDGRYIEYYYKNDKLKAECTVSFQQSNDYNVYTSYTPNDAIKYEIFKDEE